MRTLFVVLDHHPCASSRTSSSRRECGSSASSRNFRIEALDVGVSRFARRDVLNRHAVALGPLRERLSMEPKTVVGPRHRRRAALAVPVLDDADQPHWVNRDAFIGTSWIKHARKFCSCGVRERGISRAFRSSQERTLTQ